ncbi:PREDICTED: COX assembly mitochondrial protein homolog [Dinoponera quadriceps]|uniref:COX assembly mitochondrial protein n=1 Tax=Dinoponera quadriceps TaxID=609295 RepID=A0A6P3XM95_DINQU|nr:PREDICTED: COX assembly mitochondrial protein homolog [Dinoponera quadriceps]
MKEEEDKFHPSKLSGGPKGLGDPNDRSLRKVEKDILIPKIIRDRTKAEKCVDEVKEFNECCIKWSWKMIYKCRKVNENMKACMGEWYFNDDFIKECTEQYLAERKEYRETGIPKKRKKMEGTML